MKKTSMKRIAALLSVIVLLVSSVAGSFVVQASSTGSDVYVSETNGSDSNAGTASSPVATMSVALNKVSEGGTIHVVGTVSTWSVPNKNVTITGGTLDFGEDRITYLGMENKYLTFKNINLVFNHTVGDTHVFANGCNLTMGVGVSIQNSDGVLLPQNSIKLYGGTNEGNLDGDTNLTIYSGSYRCILGGGFYDEIGGNTNVWVGGNTNANDDPASHDPLAVIYGGGNGSTILGSTNVTFADNAKANYIYGGAFAGSIKKGSNVTMMGGISMSVYGGANNCTQDSDASVLMIGGEIEQLFGGCYSNNLTGNVDVKVLAGKVTRRIYGGCYNDYTGTWSSDYLVTGQITVTLGSDAIINLSESGESNDQSIYARSRYKQARSTEKSTICYADGTAKSMHSGKLGSADSTMSWIMSSVSAADNTHTHTLNYAVNTDGKTIVEACLDSQCSHTSSATINIEEKEREYNGKAHEGATVTYARDWLVTRNLAVTYANNIKVGTATASITHGGATASVNYTISKATGNSAIIEEDGVKYIWYEDISTYRTTKDEDGYYTQSPKLSGYVFGGWFAECEDTSSIGAVTSGGAWAKFVPQKTFTIKAQISIVEPTSGVSFDDLLTSVEKVNLRFVTGVDSLKYQKVIFQVTHLTKTLEYEMTKVMSKIDVKEEEDSTYKEKIASDVFGTAAEYFATLRFTGIAASTANAGRFLKDWTVTPMLVTQDGTIVEGITREELKISDAITEKFQVGSNTGSMKYDEVGGTVTANLSDGGVHTLYFATNNTTNSSKNWEIKGAFTNLEGAPMKGFTIDSEDDTKTGYYTMYEDCVALNECWNEENQWNTYREDNKHVWGTTRYNEGIAAVGDYVRFKAVLRDDVFSLWIDDELVWQLPLTNEKFGGFTAGTPYRFAIRCLDNNKKVEWSDLSVKYGEDVDEYKFLVDVKNTDVIADTINGKVTENLTNGDMNSMYFATNNASASSQSWEITGTFKQLTELTKGFTIQKWDKTKAVFYTMNTGGVSVNLNPAQDEWTEYSAGVRCVFANADYDELSDGTAKKFKAVIQDDIFSLLVEDELVWQLPLTDARFGGFEAGTYYRFALRCQGIGGQAEWSDLTVKYGEDVGEYKFLVDAKNADMIVDTMNGKVTANLTNVVMNTLWFATNTLGEYSEDWEITGNLQQFTNITKGFAIQAGDQTRYFTMKENAVTYTEPNVKSFDVANSTSNVFLNTDYNALSTGYEAKKFKAVIKDNIFSFWVEDKLVWQLSLKTYGGFDAGTSYRFGLIAKGQDCKVEWSNLMVKYGENVGNYKFQVAIKNDYITADTMNGTITAELKDANTHRLYFATNVASHSSKSWEITGTFTQFSELVKGFTIQNWDENLAGFYTMNTAGVVYQKWQPGKTGTATTHEFDDENVFSNDDYLKLVNGTEAKNFKVEIKNDIFSFWVEDQLVWKLNLTEPMYGGFTAGTSYRFAIHCQGNSGKAQWSDLTVKYGEDVQ